MRTHGSATPLPQKKCLEGTNKQTNNTIYAFEFDIMSKQNY